MLHNVVFSDQFWTSSPARDTECFVWSLLLLTKPSEIPGSGVLTLNRVIWMSCGQDPPFHAPQPLHKTPSFFSIFQFHKTLFFTKNSKTFEFSAKFCHFSCSQAWKSAKIQFKQPTFGPKISSESEQLVKKSVQQALNKHQSWVPPPPGPQRSEMRFKVQWNQKLTQNLNFINLKRS